MRDDPLEPWMDEYHGINKGEDGLMRHPLLNDPLLRAVLARPRAESGPDVAAWRLRRAEVLYFFAMGYAGDGPQFLDIRSQGHGYARSAVRLTPDDIGYPNGEDYYLAADWGPFELWLWNNRNDLEAELLALAK